MCEKCTPKIEYDVTITLCPKRREALGKAIGLMNLMAEKNPDPSYKVFSDDLEKIGCQIMDQIDDINEKLGIEKGG